MNRQTYISYIKNIIEYGSLTNAAKALGISQPALSQGISSLEKELGFKIFYRKSSPISLTNEGKIYLEYIKQLECLDNNFNNKISMYKASIQNKVSICAPNVYIDNIVIPAVSQLIKENPSFQISIKVASLEESIELAQNTETDIFISTSNNIDDNFTLEKLYSEEIVMGVPTDNPINKKLSKKFDISLIGNENIIFLEEKYPLQEKIDSFLLSNNIQPSKKIIVNQVSHAILLCNQGLGICFAPIEAFPANSKLIKTYPLDIQGRDIYIAYDKSFFLTEATNKLIEILKETKA